MANDIQQLLSANQALAAMAQRRDLAKLLLDTMPQAQPARVSIEGNRFTLVDEAGNKQPLSTLHMDVIIVDINPHRSKILYPEGKYDPNNVQAPICYSDNGVGASSKAQQPQHTSCQLCPHNAWGSAVAVDGGPAKACRDVQKLAVLVLEHGKGKIWLLSVPPNSLKNLGAYTKLLATHGANPILLITRVTFVPGVMGTLQFEAARFIDDQEGAAVAATEGKTDDVLNLGDRPSDHAALSGPAPAAPRPAAPAITPAPVPPAPPPVPPPAAPVAPAAPLTGEILPPAAPPAAPRGRGRPPRSAQPPAPAPAAPPTPAPADDPADPGPIPAFMQRSAVFNPTPGFNPPANGGQAAFAPAAAPGPDLQSAIHKAFAEG